MKKLPIWRSMLFVPAHVQRFVDRAHERGADAVILDLEDSVPLAQKAEARALLKAHAAPLAARGLAVLVRINAEPHLGQADLAAAVGPGISAIVLPKVQSGETVRAAAAQIEMLERQQGLVPNQIRLIAQIEDVQALPVLDEIATSSPRLLGMILGSEDFSVSVGMHPVPEALLLPNQLVLYACRRAGILPFGFPASIAEFTDLPALRHQVQFARLLGFVGAFCVHPAQVAVLNEAFGVSRDEVAHAQALLKVYEEALREGRGAAEYGGKMIDAPVVNRAQELLHRAQNPSTHSES